MKQISGPLKLELAQFREVEAFLSFASDLDETTLHTLNRGMRLVELLKQRQYEPLAIDVQIVLIFAGIRGFLDSMPTALISKFVDHLVKLYSVKYARSLNVNAKLDNDFVSSIINEAKSSF
jgi:F-type H+-transporting ATPase subunit alpha